MYATYLEILEGPRKGERQQIWEGVRIGRTTGELILDDPKVSGLHAQIEKDAKGAFVLVDRDSVNGLKINGKKVRRVALLPGVRFQVGRTPFRVYEAVGELPAAPPKLAPVQRDWKTVLLQELPRLPSVNKESSSRIEAFRPALQLHFVEGIQLDQIITLGYGPRRFGSDILDVELREPLCPPLAFELISEGGVPFFRTQYPKLVSLNGQQIATSALKEGDQIRVGQTLILVSFA